MIQIALCYDNALKNYTDHINNSIKHNTKRVFEINHLLYTTEFRDINPAGSVKSRAQFLRFDIPNRLDIDKCLYFDNDVIIQGDVGELWDINIDDYLLAAVIDPFHSSIKYIQRFQGDVDSKYHDLPVFLSGQLVINCKKFRDENVSQQIFDFVRRYQCCDMIAMNCVCAGKILPLDPLWCAPANYINEKLVGNTPRINGIDYSEAKLFHFHGKKKPWLGNLNNKTLEEMYVKYL
jgi:lipopolysaccharide biosynthesis glycosyltransferase